MKSHKFRKKNDICACKSANKSADKSSNYPSYKGQIPMFTASYRRIFPKFCTNLFKVIWGPPANILVPYALE